MFELAADEKAFITAFFSYTPLPKAFKLANQIFVALAFVALWVAATISTRFITEADSAIGSYLIGVFCDWAILFWLSYAIFRWFADSRESYRVVEQYVSLKKGLITAKEITAPISRIQHIEVNQGAIDRLFGLGQLRILSAGHALTINGLPADEAQLIRQRLLLKIKGDHLE